METRNISRALLRWVVILVVGSMVIGLLLWPLATAFGADTAPATPAPANPHAGVPGAPGGTPATAAPSSPSLAGKLGAEFTHLVVTSQDGVVSIFEMIQLVNDTDQPTGPITAPLLEGARNLQLMGLGPDQFSQTADGVVDKVGLEAHASKQLAYRYEVAVGGQALTLRQSFGFPVAQIFILTDPATLTMPAAINTAFEDAGGLEINGRVYRQLARGELPVGEALQVALQLTPDEEALAQAAAAGGTDSSTPQQPGQAPAASSNATLYVAMGAVLLAALVVAVAWFTRRRKSVGLAGAGAPALLEQSASVPVLEAVATLNRRKADLINEIAGLDQLRAQGDLDEGAYAEQRGALKQELIAVMRELKSLEG